MTTGRDVMTGPAADAVRETWVQFGAHARSCKACVNVLAALLSDPGGVHRHDQYERCCSTGAGLWGEWDVAVSKLIDHLQRSRRQPVGVR